MITKIKRNNIKIRNTRQFIIRIIYFIIIAIIILSIIGTFSIYNGFMENFYINEEKGYEILDSVVSSDDFVLIEGSSYRYYSKN